MRLMTLINEFSHKCLAIVARPINVIGVMEMQADAMLFNGTLVTSVREWPRIIAKVLRERLIGLVTGKLYMNRIALGEWLL